MKIGIIGSSLSGLVAGYKLTKAGHNITLFEQSRKLGDRLVTKKTEQGFFDYGLPFIFPQKQELQTFVDGLVKENKLFKWSNCFHYYDGTQLHDMHPDRDQDADKYYASSNGISTVVKKLRRWLQLESPVRVGGLTHIGAAPSKKRSWMINLTNINVFECDAVIIATDAVNAMAILSTAQDETATRRLSRYIDEVSYQPRFSLMASFDDEAPAWQGIGCDESKLKWIGNDSSKNPQSKGTQLTIQSSGAYAEKFKEADKQTVIDDMLAEASEIIGKELNSNETYLHFWNFYKPKKVLDNYFMELEMKEAPLALVGDYFEEWSVDAAYLSGLYLAEYWINKFEENKEETVTA